MRETENTNDFSVYTGKYNRKLSRPRTVRAGLETNEIAFMI